VGEVGHGETGERGFELPERGLAATEHADDAEIETRKRGGGIVGPAAPLQKQLEERVARRRHGEYGVHDDGQCADEGEEAEQARAESRPGRRRRGRAGRRAAPSRRSTLCPIGIEAGR
jgi:hypothetical protein